MNDKSNLPSLVENIFLSKKSFPLDMLYFIIFSDENGIKNYVSLSEVVKNLKNEKIQIVYHYELDLLIDLVCEITYEKRKNLSLKLCIF